MVFWASPLIPGSSGMNSLIPGPRVVVQEEALWVGVAHGAEVGPAAPGAEVGPAAAAGAEQVVAPGVRAPVIYGETPVGQAPGEVGVGPEKGLGLGTSGIGIIRAGENQEIIRAGEIKGKAQDRHGIGTIRGKVLVRARQLGQGQVLGPIGTGVRQPQLPGTLKHAPGKQRRLKHHQRPKLQVRLVQTNRLALDPGQGWGHRLGLEVLGPQQLTQSSHLSTGSKTFQLKPGMRFFDGSDLTLTPHLLLQVANKLL